MALRTENGWYQVGANACEWTKIPGTNVTLQIQKGWPLIVMRAYAADYNAYVEPLRDADSACWTPTNSVATSNHLSGTAMDLNWNSHPFKVSNAGYTPQMIATMRELLAFYEGTMFWAQDWTSPKDAMHHQMGYGTYDNPKVSDFIRRKIRGDGFSTFRRDATAPPTAPDAVAILRRAMTPTGLSDETLAAYLPHFTEAMRAAEINTVRRGAAWCSQIGHESAGLRYMAEIQTDGLGWSEDRRIYRGRGPIQLTWSTNYRKFGQWCAAKGYVTDPELFVKQPTLVEQPRWGFLAASWYWLNAGPRPGRINDYADQGDILAVSRCINGWIEGQNPNGWDDRRSRYSNALAMGDQLLAMLGDTEPADPWEELLMSNTPLESISLYATPGETRRFTPAEMLQSVDGMTHRALVERDARLGDADALARIVRVARGEGKYRDQAAIDHAIAVLAEIDGKTTDQIRALLKGQPA